MTQLITFKLPEKILEDVDSIVSKFGFANRTDFIRNSLREKIEEYNLKEALLRLEQNKGFAKDKKISDAEFEKAKEKAFNSLLTKVK